MDLMIVGACGPVGEKNEISRFHDDFNKDGQYSNPYFNRILPRSSIRHNALADKLTGIQVNDEGQQKGQLGRQDKEKEDSPTAKDR